MGDEIIGTKHSDTLTGTASGDTIRGLDGNDTLSGLDGEDLLDGGVDYDRLIGGKGADQLFGGDGNDILLGGGGIDRLVGGFGYDTASFELTPSAVAVMLPSGASATVTIGGVAADTIESCEGIIGGSGNDQLIFLDPVTQYSWADVGAGDDVLVASFVTGGSGFDTLDLSSVGPPESPYELDRLHVNMLEGSWGFGRNSPFTLTGIEKVIGSAYADILYGSAGADVLDAGAGDDWIYSDGVSLGQDILNGGLGDDYVSAYGGDVAMNGGEGDDDLLIGYIYQSKEYIGHYSVDGGGGQDALTFYTRQTMNLDLKRGTFVSGTKQGTVSGVEDVYVGSGADTLKGDDADNELAGFGGADVLVGRGGNDLLIADADGDGSADAADLLTGRRGADIFRFARVGIAPNAPAGTDRITDYSAQQGDRIDLTGVDGRNSSKVINPLAFIATDAFSSNAGELRYEIVDSVTYLYANIDGDSDAEYVLVLDGEHAIRFKDLIGVLDGAQPSVILGTPGADMLTGTDRDDLIEGGRGNDVLNGADGDDKLKGQGGADIFIANAGHDLMQGGAGRDTADYSDEQREVSITLSYEIADVFIDGIAEDRLSGIEVLIGGGGDDRLIGGDELTGGAGDDYLIGSENAVISGGEGDDYLSASAALVDGGEGIDTFGVIGSNSDYNTLTVDLIAETTVFDQLIRSIKNVENVTIISGRAIVLGSDGINRLIGGDGDDTLDGRGAGDGRDYIYGGAGNDAIRFGEGDADLIGGTDSDAFFVHADGAASVMIDGGEGTDGLIMRDAAGSVWVDLEAGTFDVAGGASGSLASIEFAIGGRFGDVIAGTSGANSIWGGGGADRLTGGAGADTFVYETVGDSSRGQFDRITDFSQAEHDRIELGYIRLEHGLKDFTFIGAAAFSGDDYELRYHVIDGVTWVEADSDKDGTADLVIHLDGAIDLTAADFIL